MITATPEQIAAVSQKWNELPAKPAAKPSARQVVKRMYEGITMLRARDYSWADICELIEKDFGVTLAPITLEQYTCLTRKERESQQ